MYFSLKESNSDKETLIVLRYFISKREGRFVFSTGITISPKDWDKTTKMAKGSRGRTNLSAINRKLQEYSTFLEKTLSFLELNGLEVTKAILKEKFRMEFKLKDNDHSKFIYFTDFTSDFIKKAPELTNRSTKRKYTKLKLIEYTNANNRIKEYERDKKLRIKINGFTLGRYDKFVDYLQEHRGYSINSIGLYIKNIVVFLRKAEELGYVVHSDYKEQAFAILKEESIALALTESEIESIFNYDFSNDEKLQNCRDLAIIGLWTGLRVSDFLSLPEIKEKDRFITVQPQKTKNTSGKKVVIPLHHHIKEVIAKRGMPKMITLNEFNKSFKEVGEKVGLVEKIKGSVMVKDKKEKRLRKKAGVYSKYKLISSHTCRRSFATNLYKMNFPTLSIMQITGHTTEASFLKYIKVTPTEHAEKLLAHWEAYYGNHQ